MRPVRILAWSPIARLIAGFVVTTLAFTACGDRAADVQRFALDRSQAVTFPSSDGVKLSGRLFGSEDATAGVVLSHMLPADQTSWWEEAARLGDAGYLVLTFDFRGYCPGGDAGCSAGTKDPSAAWQDVQGAVEELRSRGATRVALLGASMGGTASLVVAGQPDADIEAVGTLSAPASIEGMTVTPELLQATTAAKLFVAGNGDTGPAADAQTFYDLSSQPKRLEIVPSNDHGTDLLEGNQSENVRNLLQTWLEQYLPVELDQT